ncbi:MAG TPA: ABC transporter permease [Candidatus Acidoferrales bacterium]|nr:ABC transporter permease [Candidatus Acidoferrales bacterium]
MSLKDLFLDVLHTLWSHKLRTFLTMFGISWGIVSIVLMVAAGEGFRVGQKRQQETFAKDLMIVFAGRTSLQAGGTKAGRRIRYEVEDVTYVTENAPACKNVMPELGQDDITVRSAFNNGRPTVAGSYPEFGEIRSVDVAEGRFYNWQDVNEKRRVAFLGSDIAKQLFPQGGAIGRFVYLNNIPYLVIGLMRDKKQDSSYDGWDVNKVFVPFTVMVEDFPNKPPALPKSIDRLLVTPQSVPQHESCKLQLRAALARLHQYDPADKEAAGIWDTIEEAKAFQQMTDGMKYFLGAVGVTTLFLGGLGVMNVMLVAVRERTREIGVRKAVGAPAASILRQFFLETVIIVFLSGGTGLGVAFGLCALVNLAPMPPFFAGFLATWTTGLTAVGLLGTVAILAALYPASKAASIDPIEALRYEAGG